MAVKMIILDLDGTLFDTRADIVNSVNQARVGSGLEPLPFDRIVAMVGNGVEVLAERAFRDSQFGPEQALRQLMAYYKPEQNETAELYPGVRETLPMLGQILVIVSNKPKRLVENLLAKAGIDHYFDFVAGGDSFERLKPDPMALEFLGQKYSVKPNEMLVVGDHKPDILMAKADGARSIYCNYGFFGKDSEGADFTIDQFAELLPIVRRLDGKQAEKGGGERNEERGHGRPNYRARMSDYRSKRR